MLLLLLSFCRGYSCLTPINNSTTKRIPFCIICSSKISTPLTLLLLLLCSSSPTVVETLIPSSARTRSRRSVPKRPNFQKYNMPTTNAIKDNFPEEKDWNLRDSQPGSSSLLTVGYKIQQTAEPCVILMKQIISEYIPLWTDRGGIYSLAQVSCVEEKND